MAIIAALEHNQWFTKLSTKDYKLVRLIQTPVHVAVCFSFYRKPRTKIGKTTIKIWQYNIYEANSVLVFQSTDVCDQILRVVARSSRLEELVLDNAGLKRSEVK